MENGFEIKGADGVLHSSVSAKDSMSSWTATQGMLGNFKHQTSLNFGDFGGVTAGARVTLCSSVSEQSCCEGGMAAHNSQNQS